LGPSLLRRPKYAGARIVVTSIESARHLVPKGAALFVARSGRVEAPAA
jgi:hypothetical protein